MKTVKFSRHAKRRIRLYNLREEVIVELLSDVKKQGQQEIVKKVSGFDKPIKVVFDVQEEYIVVVSAYPLKRGLK
jgi:hypothetical protein